MRKKGGGGGGGGGRGGDGNEERGEDKKNEIKDGKNGRRSRFGGRVAVGLGGGAGGWRFGPRDWVRELLAHIFSWLLACPKLANLGLRPDVLRRPAASSVIGSRAGPPPADSSRDRVQAPGRARRQEPGARSQEPGGARRSQQSGARNQKPGARSQTKPGTKSQEPGTKTQEPGAKSQEEP